MPEYESYATYYGVRVSFDADQEMGIFKPVPGLNGALAYERLFPLALETDARMQSRQSFIDDMVAMQRSQVPYNWVHPDGLAGQPPTTEEKRQAVNNASDFATRVLVAFGEIKESRPRPRKIA